MVNPEKIADVDEGSKTGPAPIDGLTAEEQAQVDAMNSGNAPPGADSGGDDPGPADAGDDDGDDEGDIVAAADGDGGADTTVDKVAADGEPARKPKTISYGRHQKDLARIQKERDALQAELDGSRKETAKEREERTRLDERSRLLLEAINTKAAPAPAAAAAPTDPEPDKDEDPIGHTQWENRQFRRELDEIKSGRKQEQQLTAAQTEERQVYDSLASDIQRAAAADPTMTDAFVHLRETRYQELGFIFADIDINDPKQCATLSAADQKKLSDNIQQTFHNEQMLVARQSMAAGKSPAAVIRNLARARGWKPAEAGAAAASADGGAAAPAGKTNGAAARAAPAEAAKGSVKDQLSAVRDNLEASRSLSDAGGSPGGQMTPERLANMSQREFEEYYAAAKDNGSLDSLMGRPDNM